MKKSSKIILIIATACLAAGILTTTLAFAFAGPDLRVFSLSGEYRQESLRCALDTGMNIVYEGVAHDVVIERTDNPDLELTYWYNDQQNYESDYKGSTLRIEEKYEFRLFVFDFDFSNHTTVLRIPTSFDGSLSLTTSSGAIKVYRLASIDELTVETTSGNLDISEVEVADTLRVESVSGDVTIAEVTATQGILRTTSGNCTLDELRFGAQFEAESVSGTIRLERLQAPRITFASTSGNIRGSIVGDPQDYVIETHTTSGRVLLPSGSANAGSGAAGSGAAGTSNSLAIETISGDIEIDFVAPR
jgi:DUF4097 and DUF4098 domain-containing protein YvlB